MNSETRQCQNCKNQFTIEPDDFGFYERMNSPPPVFCPDCRMQRRLAHRNERTLYKRNCDLCQKSTISIYPNEVPFPVYCAKCWWSDDWNARGFAQDFDFTQPFLKQFKKLQGKVPRIALLVINSVNSDYTNNVEDLKNCYLVFATDGSEDCMYGRLVQRCKSVVDAAFIYDSELCYECVDCRKCYRCMFSERCQTSSDLLFCFDVRDSQNCILSTNLRHKQYCIENKQHTKEEFQKKKREILSSYESLQEAKNRFYDLRSQTLVKYAFQTKCKNATGDYLYNCHDTYLAFDVGDAKNCAYLADMEGPTDCYDGNNMYHNPELCLDLMGILQSYKVKHSTYVIYSSECEYCDSSQNIENCFGCIGMRKSKNCILNKQYSEEEYSKVKEQIVASMKKEGTYGQFFPPKLSPFGYNETLAKEYFILNKEEATSRGFLWRDDIGGTTGKETIQSNDMPSTIDEVKDSITKEILACEICNKNFRITPAELQFYRRMHLPLPRRDFECRHQSRIKQRTPRKTFHRRCVCDYKVYQNTIKHPHHPEGRCPNEFETSYAPERKEIVYCEQCYQAEVV